MKSLIMSGRFLLLIAGFSLLAGCAGVQSETQCQGLCGRPLSNAQQQVIWWSPTMRDDIDKNDEISVYHYTP